MGRTRWRRLRCAAIAAVLCSVTPLTAAAAAAAVTVNFVKPISPAPPYTYGWQDPTNWSTNPTYPNNGNPAGATYDVLIAPTGAAVGHTVQVSAPITVDSIALNGSLTRLEVSSLGTLRAVNGLNIVAGELSLSSGTLQGTRVSGGSVSVGTGSDPTLDNVTLANTTLTAQTSSSASSTARTLTAKNNLTFDNGVVDLQGRSQGHEQRLKFVGANTLGGAGEVVFNGDGDPFVACDVIEADTAGLTIAAGLTMRSGTSNAVINVTAKSLLNQGAISASANAKFIDLHNVTNAGTLEATGGGILNLIGNWGNTGTIKVGPGGRFSFGGVDAVGAIGAVQRTGGIVQYTGTINNTGNVYDLGVTPAGPIDLASGAVVNGGTLVSSHPTATPTVRFLRDEQTQGLGGGTVAFNGGVTLDTNLTVSPGQINVQGNLTLLNGRTLSLASDGGNAGLITTHPGRAALRFDTLSTIGGSGVISFDGNTPANAIYAIGNDITIGPGITVRTGSEGGIVGHFNGLNRVVNEGTVLARTAGKTIEVRGPNFTNAGTLEARDGGTIQLPSQFNLTNLAGSTLTGGKYLVGPGGTIDFDSRTFSTNNADVTLDGAGSTFDAIAPLASNPGRFTLKGGRDFTTVGPLANAGTLHVNKNSTLAVNGALTNTGKIQGNGTIVVAAGGATSSGTIAPGDSPGALTITGNLALTASSILDIEIGGATAGVDYDVLDVNGNLTLDGTLAITFVNGFAPTSTNVFDFLDFNSASGTFDTVILPPLPPGVEWDTAALARGEPAGVPEPSSVAVLAAAGAATLFLRPRRRSLKA